MAAEKILSSAGEATEYAKMYIAQNKEYLELEVTKRIAKTTSGIITIIALAFFAFLVLIFLSLTLGFFLGQLWGSYALAFLAVTFIYLAIAILFYVFRNVLITNPIVEFVIDDIIN